MGRRSSQWTDRALWEGGLRLSKGLGEQGAQKTVSELKRKSSPTPELRREPSQQPELRKESFPAVSLRKEGPFLAISFRRVKRNADSLSFQSLV